MLERICKFKRFGYSFVETKEDCLTRALAEHLNTQASDYPEYNPDTNPLNRCSIDGNIVQVY